MTWVRDDIEEKLYKQQKPNEPSQMSTQDSRTRWRCWPQNYTQTTAHIFKTTFRYNSKSVMEVEQKHVGLDGGGLVHITGLCQRKLFFFFYFMRTWRWFWLEYCARTKKSGDGCRDLFAKDGMHATFICLHADEKERKTTSELASFNNAHKAYLKQLSPPLRKYLHLDW